MTEYIDPKQYGVGEQGPESTPEQAVWAGMPVGSQNMANAITRGTLLLKQIPANKRGPKPETLRVERDWKSALAKAPKRGTPPMSIKKGAAD